MEVIAIVRQARFGLVSGDVELRENALTVLHELPPHELQQAVFALQKLGELTESAAIEVLLEANERSCTEIALSRAASFDKHARFSACLSFQEFPRPEALNFLIRWACSDEDANVRAAACWALRGIGCPETLQVLAEIAERDHELDYEGTAISLHAKRVLRILYSGGS